MKTFKKRYRLLALLLAISMILGLWTVNIFASNPITFTTSSANGWAGDSFTVNVSVSANSGIGSAQFNLAYDPNVLEFSSASMTSLTSFADNPYLTSTGNVYFAFATINGLNNGGDLFTVTFKIKDTILTPQTSALTLSVPILRSPGNTDMASTINSSSVDIKGITFGTTKTDSTIRGGSNGSITVTAPTGGAGTYQYSKDGGTSWQSSASFPALAAGVYHMKARDAATTTHVSAATDVTLTQPAAVSITSATPTDATSFHGTNGKIVVAATGGNGTYQYSKDNGTNWQDSGTFNGLSAAIYQIKARDKADTGNATAATSVTVSQPGAVAVALGTKTDVVQYGASTGSITVTATEGSNSYEYTKDDSTWQTSPTFSNLAAGVYHIRARDTADHTNYSTLLDVTIAQPTAVSFTFSKTDVAVFSASTGVITVTPAGGTSTYEFSSDNGGHWSSTNPIAGLAAGTFQVKVRDAAQTQNVSAAQSVTITQPTAVSFIAVKTNTTAAGSDNGTITVTAAGGVGAIEYSKDNGTNWQLTNSFASLAPGAYQIVVRDSTQTANVSAAQTVHIYDAVSFTASGTNLTIRNGNNGSIAVTAAGGSGSYQYSKDNGTSWQASSSFPTLTAGSYSIKVRDSVETFNAATSQTVSLTQPDAITFTSTKTDVLLYGASTGEIVIKDAAGGNGTYQYSKNGGTDWQDSNTFSGLVAGDYGIKVRDKADTANSLSKSVGILQPNRVTVTVGKTDVTTFTGTDGTITATASFASAANYEYSKDGTTWQNSNIFTGLAAGYYYITARDKDNTVNTSLPVTITIGKPAAVTFTYVAEGTTTISSNDGKITISAAGGKGTYQYSSDNGATWQDSNIFTGLKISIYNVKARDKADTTNTTAATSIEIKLKGQPLSNNDPGAVVATSSVASSTPASVAASSTATSSKASSTATSSAASSSTSTGSKTTSVVSEVTNSTTSVTVQATSSGVIPEGATLTVEEVKMTAADKKDLQEELKKAIGDIVLSEGSTYFVYDITLSSGNTTVQPNGTVTVKIPLNGLGTSVKIYRVEKDGKLTDMKAKIVDGYIVFDTTHFSQYVAVNTTDVKNPNTGSSNSFTFFFGAMAILLIGAATLIAPQRKRHLNK